MEKINVECRLVTDVNQIDSRRQSRNFARCSKNIVQGLINVVIHIYKIKKYPSGSLPKVDIQTSGKVLQV